MSPFIVALMLGVGLTVWVYNKLMGQTGGNTSNSLTAAGIIGFIGFLLMWLIMNMIT
ncbi:hypothetical protein KC957_03760 [Candidatus Saccharibacteria bacterium]|nr:hypothetical protein [Candidatus Saccharibacteria bacterium]